MWRLSTASKGETIAALERSGKKLAKVTGIFFNLNETDADDVMREAEKKLSPLFTEHSAYMTMNEALFARIKALYDNKDNLGLTREQELVLDKYYRTFVRGGALLDADKKAQFTGRPDTITLEKLAVAKACGVTRISVNPQTLCPEVLDHIGRHHSADDFYRAYNIAVKSGIKYINTDLIIGLPGDNFKSFSSTFDEIVSLDPANITVHTFCVKKSADILKSGTDVYSMRGGDAGKCVDYSQIKASQAGYIPYYMYRQKKTVGNFENVGFAKPGSEGIYNIHMMEETHSIFAIGAGAVTKLVRPAEGDEKSKITRLFNQKYPYEYLAENKSDEMIASIREFYAEEEL